MGSWEPVGSQVRTEPLALGRGWELPDFATEEGRADVIIRAPTVVPARACLPTHLAPAPQKEGGGGRGRATPRGSGGSSKLRLNSKQGTGADLRPRSTRRPSRAVGWLGAWDRRGRQPSFLLNASLIYVTILSHKGVPAPCLHPSLEPLPGCQVDLIRKTSPASSPTLAWGRGAEHDLCPSGGLCHQQAMWYVTPRSWLLCWPVGLPQV